MSAPGRRVVVGASGAVVVLAFALVFLRGPPVRVDRAPLIRAEQLSPRFEALKPLATPLGPPGDSDWLAHHREDGMTFAEYVASHPVRVTPERRTLYLQPLGDFTPAQQRVLEQTADFVGRFFQLPVKQLEALPASVVPEKARRLNPLTHQPQVLAPYVLNEVLLPRRPADALAVIALTAEDLYPDPDWNFVFGQASLKDRVGVWSLHRNGDPEQEPRLYLTRTLSTAVHELSHMLSLTHCIAYACVMNGSNSREESDSRPLELCPSCLQKLQWNIGFDPVKRDEELAAFEADAGLSESLLRLQKRRAAWKALAAPPPAAPATP